MWQLRPLIVKERFGRIRNEKLEMRNGGAAQKIMKRRGILDERYSRIVIPTEVEESFSFAVKCLHAYNEKREAPFHRERTKHGVSCKLLRAADMQKEYNKDPSTALGMTIREGGSLTSDV